jgi:ribosomal protein S18 acetylase RimI-like enzyme
MSIVQINNKQQIEQYLLRFPQFNYYHLGDLDDFFWPHTKWYARQENGEITALVLLYTAPETPVLLAILNNNREEMEALLAELVPTLKTNVYTHLSPGLEQFFEQDYLLRHHGEHYKMVLTKPEKLDLYNTDQVITLAGEDLPELETLYQAAYPGNWFDARMLETGQYVGIRSEQGELICVAGVHVFSRQYRIAALGNITTHLDYRGRGYATTASVGLCRKLGEHTDLIGLNVRSDNHTAVHTYQKIGFEIITTYHEWTMERKP